MEDEKKVKVEKRSAKIWIWGVIVLIILASASAIWFFTKKDSAEKTEETVVVEPKHSDWTLFTSNKYKFKLYHPSNYLLAESATGTLTLSDGAAQMIDMYVFDASDGSGDKMVKSQVALFTDETKGYMTGGVETTITAAGNSAKMITGTFGKNAGISQKHAGTKGSAVVFTRNNLMFIFDSYDNADFATNQIFLDILADMSF